MKQRKDILDEIVDLDVKRMHEKFFFNCKAHMNSSLNIIVF
jgi:hypothetical protein